MYLIFSSGYVYKLACKAPQNLTIHSCKLEELTLTHPWRTSQVIPFINDSLWRVHNPGTYYTVVNVFLAITVKVSPSSSSAALGARSSHLHVPFTCCITPRKLLAASDLGSSMDTMDINNLLFFWEDCYGNWVKQCKQILPASTFKTKYCLDMFR